MILSKIGKTETNCLYPINFMTGTCKEYTFFILASCEPLKAKGGDKFLCFTLLRKFKTLFIFLYMIEFGLWTSDLYLKI